MKTSRLIVHWCGRREINSTHLLELGRVCLWALLLTAHKSAVARSLPASFGAGIATPVGNQPIYVATADLNGDGKADLVVANSGDNNVSILLGNGDGSFQAATTYSTGARPIAVAIADFNADGHPDLAVVNADSNNVSILLGGANGVFQDAVNLNVGASPSSVAVGDFDADGKPDLVVAAANGVSLLSGRGDGTFQAPKVIISTPETSVAVGDFNSDGKPDIVVSGPTGRSVLLGNGDGSFKPGVYLTSNGSSAQPGTGFLFGNSNETLLVNDFNRDGKADIAAVGNGVNVFIGKGDGTFGPPLIANTAVRDFRSPAVIGDFNSDGNLDLAFVNRSNAVSMLIGKGDGSFQPPTNTTASINPISLAATDFNGDGKLDLAVLDAQEDIVTVFLGIGDGTFNAPASFATGNRPVSLSEGDFNGDGKPDLAASNSLENDLSVLLGNGNGTFQGAVNYPVGRNPQFAIISDVNGDGKPDLAVVNSDSQDISVLLGVGDGTFRTQKRYPDAFLVGWPAMGVAGDFNGDGLPDFAVTGASNPSGVSVLLNNGDSTLGAATDYSLKDVTEAVTAGDLNMDGQLDLIAIAYKSVNVFLGKGDGSFKPPSSFAGGISPSSSLYDAALADFNGDGKLDIAVTDFNANTVNILLGKGDGSFSLPIGYQVGLHPTELVIGDFNGDGVPDIAVTNRDNDTITLLLGTGDGTFETGRTYLAGPTQPSGIVAADFNGDGKLDLAVVDSYSNSVMVLLNQTTNPTPMPMLHIESVGGVSAPLLPTGSTVTTDVTLPANTNSDAVPVIIIARNIPDGTVVHLWRNGLEVGVGLLVGGKVEISFDLPLAITSLLRATATIPMSMAAIKTLPKAHGAHVTQMEVVADAAGSTVNYIGRDGRRYTLAQLRSLSGHGNG